MADTRLPSLCLGIPVDHRLEQLLTTDLTTPGSSTGGHARAIEGYGRHLEKVRADISHHEIEFAKWLAKPETTGGVVIVLLQPAQHQRYFPNHRRTVKDCGTLDAVDEVCKTVTGCGLEKISCFDVFPFHKIPATKKNVDEYEEDLDEAYAIFLAMIQQKQPDVIFCCYRSPHLTKYKDFQGIGVGHTRDSQVAFQDQSYTCVNGFHPSYALNYLEDKSALRNLFIVEATQAFMRASDNWTESSWMSKLRDQCSAIVRVDEKDKRDQPTWTKHDFQRERFYIHMGAITEILGCLHAGTYDDMTNNELYHLFLDRDYNLLLPDCLLVLIKIIRFEDHKSDQLQSKGFERLRQKEQRDVRDLRRNVERRCDEFMHSICAAGAPLQMKRGGQGLLTTASLTKSLSSLGPSSHHSGFHYDLRLTFRKLVQNLNGAFTYKGRDIYTIDRNKLNGAFRDATGYFELALAQHSVSTQSQLLEEDLEISSPFNSLSITGSYQQTSPLTRPESSQTRTGPVPSSADPRSLAVPPSTRPPEANFPLLSRATVRTSPPTA